MMRGNQKPNGQQRSNNQQQNNQRGGNPNDREIRDLMNAARGFLPNNEQEAYRLCEVCLRYGLDPLMGDVAFGKNYAKPYITFRGMVRIAQQSGELNGIEVEFIEKDHEAGVYIVKAKVWRHGCEFPFEDFGDSDMTMAKVGKIGKLRIATTRAKCRALRSAFRIPLSIEGDDEATDIVVPQGKQAKRENVNDSRRDPVPARESQGGQRQTRPQQERPKEASQPSGNTQTSQVDKHEDDSRQAWNDAKRMLGQTMNELQISADQVVKTSEEMFGKSSSAALTAKELQSLTMVLREEYQGSQIQQSQLPNIPPEPKGPRQNHR